MDKVENREILGAYLEYIRKEENLSQSFVAESLHINKGYLSRIENNGTNIPDFYIKKITEFIGVDFLNDEQRLEKARYVLFSFFDAFVALDVKKRKSILENYLQDKMDSDSLNFFHYKLMRFIYHSEYLHEFSEVRIEMNILDAYYNRVLDEKEQCIYFIFKAKYFEYHHEYEKSLDVLKEAEKKCASISDTRYIAVILHIKAVIFNLTNRGFSAYIHANRAREYFKNLTYYKRLRNVQICIANSLGLMHESKEAILIYKNLLEHSSNSDESFKWLIYQNLSWCLIDQKNYDMAIRYANKANALGSTYEELFLNIPLALYYEGKYEECISKIDEILEKRTDFYLYEFLEVLKYDIEKNESAFFKHAYQLKSLFIKYYEFEYLEILLRIMLKHYKTLEDNEKVIALQSELIDVLDRKTDEFGE